MRGDGDVEEHAVPMGIAGRASSSRRSRRRAGEAAVYIEDIEVVEPGVQAVVLESIDECPPSP